MKAIIFSTVMVQAILDGKKTQTRRVIKPQPQFKPYKNDTFGIPWWEWKGHKLLENLKGELNKNGGITHYTPYKPGDILWVRESFCRVLDERDMKIYVFYKVDKEKYNPAYVKGIKWNPSIHMPRTAARLFLRVTGVRAERLQEISGADAKAEGIQRSDREMLDGVLYEEKFVELWNSFNAKRGHGWETNPWVWVYDFEVMSEEERI